MSYSNPRVFMGALPRILVVFTALFGAAVSVFAEAPQNEVFMSVAPIGDQLRTHGVAPLPQNIYGRQLISLTGAWNFLVDPVERGLRSQYPRYTIPKDEKQQPIGGQLVEYDWDSAPLITIPGDWNTQSNPRLFWYEGLGWYRRHFAQPSVSSGQRVFLYFEAANYRSHVYLNGDEVGVHEGGFTPFAFELTGKLKSDNSLVVGVNSKRQFGNIPGSDPDWFNYGGITRPVWLVVTPETYIRHYSLSLKDQGGRETIVGTVDLDGSRAANASVTITIDSGGAGTYAATVRTDAKGHGVFEISAKGIERWSPESPKLHAVVLSTDMDRITERIGFRTIETKGADILLNGRSIFLRGVSIHEERVGDYEDDGGRKIDWDDARRLLTEAKKLGCNFVRLAHYPHTEKMTRMADELGLLVWSEIPIYQEDVPYDDPHGLALARSMQADNIARDQNRASVIVWSVANETPLTASRLAFLKTLIADARTQDSTRLISAALNRSKGKATYTSNTEVTIDDPLGEYLDLLAYNTYVGWYGPLSLPDIPKLTWHTPYNKPMILSEFGTDAKRGIHGEKEARWTEEHQAWFYELTLANANTVPWIKGLSPWILKDFRSPRRFRMDYQNYWNRKGLISETGEPKLSWKVLHDFYEQKTTEQK